MTNYFSLLHSNPIVVKNLYKRFGDFVAVEDVSFEVNEGEVFGWLGPNGAGKSTTIRILLGLLKPTSGHTFVLGFDSNLQKKEVHSHVGYMSQQFTLYNDLTPFENLCFYGGIHNMSRKDLLQRIPEILQMAGLEGRQNVITGTLSGGNKQRLSLGCAIVHRPKVIFLDEPTAGVDPISRRQFWELIYRMTKEGVTVLVTTHYMEEAELCQRIGLIHQGRLKALDSPANLKLTHMHGKLLEIGVSDPEHVIYELKSYENETQLHFDEIALYGAQIHISVIDSKFNKKLLEKWLTRRNYRVFSMEWITPSLEDVFISSIHYEKGSF
jgi:ABC-2 type transport system ATP-binding protein